MTIRNLQETDNKQLAQLIKTSLASVNLDKPGTAYFDPQLAHLSFFYEQLPHARYWVIDYQDKIIGGVGIAPLEEISKVCELQKLYVDSNFQGQGLSKKLMEVALDCAAKHYEGCYLETHTTLTNAWHLYEKYGFDRLNQPLIDSEHSAMDLWYYKRLT
ncbi:GNAT family N-acetyltransferase [Tetragenococcus koreensis]|uniref:GNAT family acetyltransferase n=1 Tax=Tetragenococcus koreensis TaxID=290335 RepID=A0AAN4UDC4_9ENTE|nr:GNAT family N-acetyltransferase [Tetragenococcus koreensis]MCF1618650.1 GNAT family N-acetyltransferase [Tetragenococcus koreensis]MCF1657815.1 GNAT family N-acetyltransferase [Tetragenococcus koreensis]GEQ50318.1 GNAT family acetyltransferase [Tetragenococcus koreensis]GEQ52798.1 GNAT family acetyltransferase [Tetragenococcus koreensis]GEQ55288.1 GNAT family acetyltransferase [Tetragenococcus koreensis]